MKTFEKDGFSEITEKRSRFLGYAKRVETTDEAERFLASVRAAHPEARHVVCAYLTDGENGESVKCSDDGEPQGTGGKPVLSLLQKRGLSHVCIAVVRYFGGILLGAPGLVRAYGAAAAAAADDAGTVRGVVRLRGSFTCGYSEYKKLSPVLQRYCAETESVDYAEEITAVFSCGEESFPPLCSAVNETTAGRIAVKRLPDGMIYVKE
ncbi:MAG: YigZ family protein [Clostridia bacterium]|nr:YigZ family protein [Clostridia bacterium]